MQFGIFALAPFFCCFFSFLFHFEYSSVSSESEKLFETKVVLFDMMCEFACNLQLVVFNRLFLPFLCCSAFFSIDVLSFKFFFVLFCDFFVLHF